MKGRWLFWVLCFSLCVEICAQQRGVSPNPDVSSTEKGILKTTFAVVVGISDYQDKDIPDLRFADKDAEAFANFLRSEAGGKLNGDHLKVLLNSQATMAQFANALDWLWESCKEGDQAIIYFSGHGDVEKKSLTQPGFLLCWDAPARVYMAGGAFALPMLQEVISTLSIQNKAKVIVITDACRSGTLAGSSVGGAQATASNLAKQFGNEIKIMSCQPNEYSIEGEQWGGGRGAFSFHLLDALYGMADSNKDLWVTLQEVGRYLEDHVSTEVAPVSQVPMVVGNRNERLAGVDEHLLTSIKSRKANQTTLLSAIESRGIEEDVLSKLDTSIIVVYQLFKTSLKNKVFLEPVGSCAETYYQQLLLEPKMQRLHSTMTRNYAAALQDDAQQVINGILKSDIEESLIVNQKKKSLTYGSYPKYLEKASELLGAQHYMYSSLKARQYYFEAQALGQANTKLGTYTIPDKQVISKMINYYHQSLQWQSDLSFVYLNLGALYGMSLRQIDSAEFYLQLSIKTTPAWIMPYVTLNDVYMINKSEKVRFPLEQANKVDSNATYLLYKWGEYFANHQKFDSAALKFMNILNTKQIGYCKPCIYNALGVTFARSGNYIEAEKHYSKAFQLDTTIDALLVNLTSLYIQLNRLPESEAMAKKWIHRYPKDARAYTLLAVNYLRANRWPEADSISRMAIQLDSMDYYPYEILSEIYMNTQRLEETETILVTGLRKNPKAVGLMINLGKLYAMMQRTSEAQQQFNRAIEMDPDNSESHLQLGLSYNQLKRYEDAGLSIQKAIQLDPQNYLPYYIFACVLSKQSKTDEALIQLETAIQKGFNMYENLQRDVELENLRLQKEQWDALMKKYFPNHLNR